MGPQCFVPCCAKSFIWHNGCRKCSHRIIGGHAELVILNLPHWWQRIWNQEKGEPLSVELWAIVMRRAWDPFLGFWARVTQTSTILSCMNDGSKVPRKNSTSSRETHLLEHHRPDWWVNNSEFLPQLHDKWRQFLLTCYIYNKISLFRGAHAHYIVLSQNTYSFIGQCGQKRIGVNTVKPEFKTTWENETWDWRIATKLNEQKGFMIPVTYSHYNCRNIER